MLSTGIYLHSAECTAHHPCVQVVYGMVRARRRRTFKRDRDKKEDEREGREGSQARETAGDQDTGKLSRRHNPISRSIRRSQPWL